MGDNDQLDSDAEYRHKILNFYNKYYQHVIENVLYLTSDQFKYIILDILHPNIKSFILDSKKCSKCKKQFSEIDNIFTYNCTTTNVFSNTVYYKKATLQTNHHSGYVYDQKYRICPFLLQFVCNDTLSQYRLCGAHSTFNNDSSFNNNLIQIIINFENDTDNGGGGGNVYDKHSYIYQNMMELLGFNINFINYVGDSSSLKVGQTSHTHDRLSKFIQLLSTNKNYNRKIYSDIELSNIFAPQSIEKINKLIDFIQNTMSKTILSERTTLDSVSFLQKYIMTHYYIQNYAIRIYLSLTYFIPLYLFDYISKNKTTINTADDDDDKMINNIGEYLLHDMVLWTYVQKYFKDNKVIKLSLKYLDRLKKAENMNHKLYQQIKTFIESNDTLTTHTNVKDTDYINIDNVNMDVDDDNNDDSNDIDNQLMKNRLLILNNIVLKIKSNIQISTVQN